MALAHRRRVEGVAAGLAALAHSPWPVPALAGPRPVQRPVALSGNAAPPGQGPQSGAASGGDRHAIGQVHCVRGPRGFDAAKKVLRRKRVALVDADGAWLAVAVLSGNVQDHDCLDTLSARKAAWPSLREVVLDGAFTAERCREWCNLHGMRHRVVERDPGHKGFVVLERRWVVERSFGWLAHWGGLLRDRAGRLDVATARLACPAVLSGIEALINPASIHAQPS